MEQEGGEVICADAGVGFTCTAASGTACGYRMPAAVESTGPDHISTTLGGNNMLWNRIRWYYYERVFMGYNPHYCPFNTICQ